MAISFLIIFKLIQVGTGLAHYFAAFDSRRWDQTSAFEFDLLEAQYWLPTLMAFSHVHVGFMGGLCYRIKFAAGLFCQWSLQRFAMRLLLQPSIDALVQGTRWATRFVGITLLRKQEAR